jgi:hypothetical protein
MQAVPKKLLLSAAISAAPEVPLKCMCRLLQHKAFKMKGVRAGGGCIRSIAKQQPGSRCSCRKKPQAATYLMRLAYVLRLLINCLETN